MDRGNWRVEKTLLLLALLPWVVLLAVGIFLKQGDSDRPVGWRSHGGAAPLSGGRPRTAFVHHMMSASTRIQTAGVRSFRQARLGPWGNEALAVAIGLTCGCAMLLGLSARRRAGIPAAMAFAPVVATVPEPAAVLTVAAPASAPAPAVDLNGVQTLETLGTLTGGVAHDFNNLLFVILGNAELALDSFDGPDPRRGPLEQIRAAGQEARGLTRQLLALGDRPGPQEVVDFNHLIRETRWFFGKILGSGVRVELNLCSEPLPIRCEVGRVRQLLLNLCSNARDASGTQGRFWVRTTLVRGEGGVALVEVGDEGCGMDAETAARIFDLFFTTKPAGKGTGLGLWVAKSVVDDLGGTLQVASTPGAGTVFTARFPLAEIAALPDPRTADRERAAES